MTEDAHVVHSYRDERQVALTQRSLSDSCDQVVLDLLQIPYDKKEDVRMNELMRLAHEFLQNFCRGNQQNQALLHKHLELFLTPGVRFSFIVFPYKKTILDEILFVRASGASFTGFYLVS